MTYSLIASLAASAGVVLAASAFGGGGSTPNALVMGDGVRSLAVDDAAFVNFETPHVHPLELSADGSRLFAVNTAAGSLEVFSVASGVPRQTGSVAVGVDPVSVRQRTSNEAWVVNHISDSISIVDLTRMTVVATIHTADEPADVVFAQGRAFVSCAQANVIQVFDAANPTAPTNEIAIEAEDPRSLAVSPDGQTVYAAIFESGNGTTILAGGAANNVIAFPPNAVNSPLGPYNGVNPPPNSGGSFSPSINGANPPPLPVGLIVRQDAQGNWLDDNSGDWTPIVTGSDAAASGRPVGWQLLDHDVAVIDASSLSLSYQDRLMNFNMAMGVNPVTGQIAVVGTEATNEVRYEPNLNGRFVRVHGAVFNAGGANASVTDLNPHLSYPAGPAFAPVAQAQRDRSLGDPRGIAFNSGGTRAYVTGMGSNTVGVFDGALNRVGPVEQIEVGQGPTGIVVDDARNRLYVLNKFDGSISTVDLVSGTQTSVTPFFDPTPIAIKLGRPFLYDTHRTSGLGQLSCGSCHVDSRFDRLAWDLGNPAGDMKTFDQNCADGGCEDWHPMKGPMTTQTLQDIIGKEPHHWRGDKSGLEQFNAAFTDLLGDDAPLNALEMQQFEDFLASIYYGPNPNRGLMNELPTGLDLTGHFTVGRFAAQGQPMPAGNAAAAVNPYRTAGLDGVQCVTCHTLPTGQGSNFRVQGFTLVEVPIGPLGELHHTVVSVDGSTNVSLKVPQTRNMQEKAGFNTTQMTSTAGFGYIHDGSVDSIERFIAEPVFSIANLQQLADLTAFMLSFSGSDLPTPPGNGNVFEPRGPESQDAHAAVGQQLTMTGGPEPAGMATVRNQADLGRVGIIVKGEFAGELRGFVYLGGGIYQSDRASETATHAQLLAAAAVGAELTWTTVDTRTAQRLGVDTDLDGFLDRDELDGCSDERDATSTPLNSVCCPADLNNDGILDNGDIGAFVALFLAGDLSADLNGDSILDNGDISAFVAAFLAGC
ncbi:MAG: YVTN family beta-propeller protein [Phycisphaerales bacterium]|jgi:YVTN family beta-propeller protein